MQSSEVYERWEPLPNLPELQFGVVRYSYDGYKLRIEADYWDDPEDRVLTLELYARAFKAYEEFSDPWMEEKPALPKLQVPGNQNKTWPLQEVRNSIWLDRVVERDGGIDDINWRHFVISSHDKSVHVMAVEFDKVEIR